MNKHNTRVLLSMVLAISAYLIAQLFGFLGFALIGAGHGSGIFGYLFYSPVVGGHGSYLYLGLIIWPSIGILLPWARNPLVSCVILILLGCDYFGLIRNISADITEAGTASYAINLMKQTPDLAGVIICAFVLCQMAVIGSLIYLRTSKRG
jgi:small-conductance mechanosensitive channel